MDVNNQEMLQSLHQLLSIPSVISYGSGDTPFGVESDRALTYALSLCEQLGFTTKNCNHMVGWAEIGSGAEMVAILVHLDVVPAGHDWDYPPFACTLDNGRLYGRGIVDDKGPAIACIYAMKDILDSGIPLNRRIRIIFGLAEEGGDWTDMEYYCQHEELPLYGFTPDGKFPVIYGEKGFATYHLFMPLADSGVELLDGGEAANMVPDQCRAVVAGKPYATQGISCHGSKPWEGENAISKLMAQLSGVPIADFYNQYLGFDLYGLRLGCQAEDDKLGKLTVNVGKVKTVGDEILFYLNIRFPTICTPQQILDCLTPIAQRHGGRVIMDYGMKPIYMALDSPLITALLGAYQQVTGDTTTAPVLMGGGTYAKSMDNITAFGPMIPGHPLTEHQKNEYMELKDFLLTREIYRVSLENLLKA